MPHFTELLSQSAARARGLWSHKPEEVVRNLQAAAKLQVSVEYRTRQEELHEFYLGRHLDHMKRVIRAVLPQEAERLISSLGGLDAMDLVSMITRDLSVVFHREPETDLVNTDTGEALAEDHPDRALWKADRASVLLGPTLRQVDAYTTLFRTCPVQVAWIDDGVTDPHVQWIAHPAYRCHVNQSLANPLSAQAAHSVHIELPSAVHSATGSQPARMLSWFRLAGADGGNEWHYLVHDENGHTDRSMMTLSADPADTSNPYALHPIAVFRDELPERGHFFGPWREAWWLRQRQVNLQLVDLVNICRHQGFSLLVAEGAENFPKEQTISPGARIDVLSGGTLKYVTANPNISQLETVLENGLRRMAIIEGLPSDHWTYLGGVRNLGALKMTRERKKLRQRANIPLYDVAMRELWRAHVAVCNEHRPQKYADTTGLRVTYPELPEVVDEFQHTQSLDRRLAYNLTNPVAEVARERGVSMDEAERIVADNLTRNAELPRLVSLKHEEEPAPPGAGEPAAPAAAAAGDGVPRPADVRS